MFKDENEALKIENAQLKSRINQMRESGMQIMESETAKTRMVIELREDNAQLRKHSQELVACIRSADADGFMVLLYQNERLVEIWNRRIAQAFSELEDFIAAS